MLKHVLPWLTLLAIAATIHLVHPGLFPSIFHLLEAGDIESFADYLRSFGIWTVAVSILVNIIINLAGVIPTVFISGANGIVFGLVWGTVISWLGECAGTVIAFVLWRNLLQSVAKKLIARSPYLSKANEFSASNGFKAMLIARLIPLAPSGIITILGAVSSLSFRDMALATLLGKLPSIALEVLLGHDLAFAQDNKLRLAVLVLVLLLSYVYLWRKKNKMPAS